MTTTKQKIKRPTVLVLEGLSGAAACVRQAGGLALTLSPRDPDAIIAAFNEDALDAVLLTGGGDVDPRRYARSINRATYGVSEDRDVAELTAMNYAIAWKVPVLGICRGAQLMNVHGGGTLYQNLPDRLGGSHVHRSGQSRVRFLAGSLAAEAVGKETTSVMHLHHQAIRKVGHNYRASAWHHDGTIEAIESTSGAWRIGAQFHPEYVGVTAPERGLFRQLVVQAAKYADMPVPPVMATRKPRLPKPTPASIVQYSGKVWDRDKYGVTTWWKCFRCGIDFDLRNDYVDHMFELHDVDLDRPAILESN